MKRKLLSRRTLAILLVILMVTPAFLAGCGKYEGDTEYIFAVKTEGGMAVKDVQVTVSKGLGKVAEGKTDEAGEFTASLAAEEYTVKVSELAPGFSATSESVKTTKDGGVQNVTLTTSVITDPEPASHTAYQVGDVMYDFTFDKDGVSVKLSELLKTKKLVVLNFWATWCGPCKSEFPAVEEALGEYADEVEFIAFSISDTTAACESFREENGYSFAMLQDIGLYEKFEAFGGGAIPFTLFIDRYGVFINYINGADPDVQAWLEEFEGYTSDGYVQRPGQPISSESGGEEEDLPEKPDVTMPPSSKIEAAINAKGFKASYVAPSSDTVWPWVLADDNKSIVPSNIGKHSTTAMISTDIEFEEGQVLAFDYRSSIERDAASIYDYDLLSVYVDGFLQKKVYDSHDDYTTLYVYTPVKAGKHTVTITYVKDSSDTYLPGGKEFLNITNMRFEKVSDLKSKGASLLVYRQAATDVNSADDPKTSYLNYADVVLNKNDGYYHVGSAEGPILLCDLMGATAWASESLNNLAYGGYLVIGGVDYSERITEYTWQQSHSTIPYAPVDRRLSDMLDLVASSIGEGPDHDDEWLEFCGYFDHYGAGDGITKVFDVRQGISVDSAFPAKEGKNHVVVNQVLVPRGLYYEFSPTKSGAYSFYSVNNGAGEEGMIDTFAWMVLPDGTLRGNFVCENDYGGEDENFLINYYCEAGEKYYILVAFNLPDTLGEFDFMIEYLGASYDDFVDCTNHYVSNEDGTELFVDRLYDIHAELGTDGYYHQVLSYNADGSAVLDYSEHGYIYVDFEGIPVFMGFLMYNGEYISLKDYIQLNGKTADFGFDFTNRVDSEGNSLKELGNCQPQMEAYLDKVEKTGVEKGFVRADKELVDILNNTLIRLYGEYNGNEIIPDQWLMFCKFYRHLG